MLQVTIGVRVVVSEIHRIFGMLKLITELKRIVVTTLPYILFLETILEIRNVLTTSMPALLIFLILFL